MNKFTQKDQQALFDLVSKPVGNENLKILAGYSFWYSSWKKHYRPQVLQRPSLNHFRHSDGRRKLTTRSISRLRFGEHWMIKYPAQSLGGHQEIPRRHQTWPLWAEQTEFLDQRTSWTYYVTKLRNSIQWFRPVQAVQNLKKVYSEAT